MGNYILEGKSPVLEPDILTWARWYGTADRIVSKTNLPGEVTVSTVFLAIDHAYDGGRPLLFETMIFGGMHDQYQQRYSTWDEAFAGHQLAIEMVFAP